MRDLPIYYREDIGWVMNVPRGPTPEQMIYLKEFVKEPKIVKYLTIHLAHLEPTQRTKIMKDFVNCKISFNILGDQMNGIGDLRLFEAPKPREKVYSYRSK